MDNIKKITSQSFSVLNDNEIDFSIKENGAPNLLTSTYDKKLAEQRKFYNKPEIAENSDEVKLSVIYGKALISPFIIDMGASASTNDPSNIIKTIRWIASEGEAEGIPVGPNGSPLENVYIDDGNNPQPVIDSDGKPSNGDIVLNSFYGAAIDAGASMLWDYTKGLLGDDKKISDIDPTTGLPIKTKDQKAIEQQLNSIGVGDLNNVITEQIGQDYILCYDNCSGEWISKSINKLMAEAISINVISGRGGSGGRGGDGAAGGAGGRGGKGGDAICTPKSTEDLIQARIDNILDEYYPSNIDLPEADAISEIEMGVTSAPSNYILLPKYTENQSNIYTQTVNISDTTGIKITFYYGELWKMKSWVCQGHPQSPLNYKDGGLVEVKICLSTTINGKETTIFETVKSESGLYNTNYHLTTEVIAWDQTSLSPIIDQFGFSALENSEVTLKISRIDGKDDGIVKSDTEVYLVGFIFAYDYDYEQTNPPVVCPPPSIPAFSQKESDGYVPDVYPENYQFLDEDCPPSEGGQPPPTVPPEYICVGSEGQLGENGGQGDSGFDGEEGEEGEDVVIEISEVQTKPEPSILFESPSARLYTKGETTKLPTIRFINDGEGGTPELRYSQIIGLFKFDFEGIPPTGVVVSGQNTASLTINGPTENSLIEASKQVVLIPSDTATGVLKWKATATTPNGCSGQLHSVTPNVLIVEESQSAMASILLSGTDGTWRVYATLPNKEKRELTSQAVPFRIDLPTTAVDIVNNINSNIDVKNALNPKDTNWLPKFVASADGVTEQIQFTAPVGSEFNVSKIEVDGAIVGSESLLDFMGGATKNKLGLFDNSIWDKTIDVLAGIGGVTAGTAIGNILMNNASSLEISIPYSVNTTVSFLYKGMKVNVPKEYDEINRTNLPTYEDWSGEWKKVWTDNPAFCVLSYILNRKYGLGNDLDLSPEDVIQLEKDIFKIAEYCDDRPFGDEQPRFNINTVITDGTKSEILTQMVSVFYGAVIYHAGGIRIHADMPDPVIKKIINQSNCTSIEYENSSLKNFVNQVELSYLDETNMYRKSVVIAESEREIANYGLKKKSLVAFGITNEKQAQAYALWYLNTEYENSNVVKFTGGIECHNLIAGQVVALSDSEEDPVRRGGRIMSINGNVITLDGDTFAEIGDSFYLTLGDGSIFESSITQVNDREITINNVIENIIPNTTFLIANPSIGPNLYKIISVSENGDTQYNVIMQKFTNNKFTIG